MRNFYITRALVAASTLLLSCSSPATTARTLAQDDEQIRLGSVLEIVSTDADGTPLRGKFRNPQVSSDGKRVVFESVFLETTGTPRAQILLKNLETGELRVVSSTTTGEEGNGVSQLPQISADGNLVVFESTATNLVRGASGQQVYAKNLRTGRVSLVSGSAQDAPGNYFSHAPAIDASGMKAYFQGNSSNLVPNGDRLYRIYEKTLSTGAIRIVSTNATGARADAAAMRPVVSANGAFLFFESNATNLVSGVSGNQLYRKELISGAVDLVSSDTQGRPGSRSSAFAAETQNGSLVAFTSHAWSDSMQVYVKNLGSPVLAANELLLASSDSRARAGNASSAYPIFSPGHVWFMSGAEFTNDPNPEGTLRIYRKNLVTGALSRIENTPARIMGRFSLASTFVREENTTLEHTLIFAAQSETQPELSQIYMLKTQ